jgi:hypothetical protein
MNLNLYIKEFATNINIFEMLVKDVDEKQLAWKQNPDKWNLLEILCHLVDEEREDFRTWLRIVVEDPNNPFPSIDPVGWVKERNYAQQDKDKVLSSLKQERSNSIEWLRSLGSANWSNTYIHPKLGPMSAKFILANWLAHDYLHIRQITRLKYDYLKDISNENLSYAGNW